MSLGPTFVETQSGVWYKDPVIRRPDWFICWDEDEPIELVIKRPGPTCDDILRNLAQAGWQLKRYSKRSGRAHRCFTGNFSDPMHPAEAFFLTQLNGPTDDLLEGCEKADCLDRRGQPQREGTYYFADMNGHQS